jgi:hypothetical protein
MKDPVIIGAILSAGILLVLAAWKAPVLRWAAICLALGVLAWAVSQAGLVADLRPRSLTCTAAGPGGSTCGASIQVILLRATVRAT